MERGRSPQPETRAASVRAARVVAGRRISNSLPLPGPSLRAVAVPPWSWTRLFTSASPRPRPPSFRSVLRWPCTKMSKMRGSRSGAIPTPLSLTVTTTSPPSAVARTATSPPGSVYRAAFVSRLATTCASRTTSPSTRSPPAGTSIVRRCRRCSSRSLAISTAFAIATAISTGSLRRTILPRVIFDTSSRSSTSRTRWPTWRSMISRSRIPPSRRRRSSSAVTIGESGLRSSWPSMARNSSFARLAASSSRRRSSRSAAATSRAR